MTVTRAAEAIQRRARLRGLRGRTATAAEIDALNGALGGTYPAWMAELIQSVPLCGLELGWQARQSEPRSDGIDWLEWCDAASVIRESVELYPGLAILSSGFINVAGCSMGSGDPYFISIHEGTDPPLYRFFHDVSDQAGAILSEGRTTVAACLSEFFEHAIV